MTTISPSANAATASAPNPLLPWARIRLEALCRDGRAAPMRAVIEQVLAADLMLLAALEEREVVESLSEAGEAGRHPRGAVQAVVDLRAQQASPLPAPGWADAARCL